MIFKNLIRFTKKLSSFIRLWKLVSGDLDTIMSDNLTGLYQREIFLRLAEKHLEAVETSKRFTSVVFIDLDKLKEINDSLGHKAGDELLLSFACTLKECIRSYDISCRWGGDEFVLLLEGDEKTAKRAIERITRKLEGKIPFSYGISVMKGMSFSEFEIALNEADEKMYLHKRTKQPS